MITRSILIGIVLFLTLNLFCQDTITYRRLRENDDSSYYLNKYDDNNKSIEIKYTGIAVKYYVPEVKWKAESLYKNKPIKEHNGLLIKELWNFYEGKKHGTYIEFDWYGDTIAFGNYEEGKKVGKWYEYGWKRLRGARVRIPNSIRSLEEYKKGVLHGNSLKSYNGRRTFSGQYKNGKKVGKFVWYDTKGKVTRKERYNWFTNSLKYISKTADAKIGFHLLGVHIGRFCIGLINRSYGGVNIGLFNHGTGGVNIGLINMSVVNRGVGNYYHKYGGLNTDKTFMFGLINWSRIRINNRADKCMALQFGLLNAGKYGRYKESKRIKVLPIINPCVKPGKTKNMERRDSKRWDRKYRDSHLWATKERYKRIKWNYKNPGVNFEKGKIQALISENATKSEAKKLFSLLDLNIIKETKIHGLLTYTLETKVGEERKFAQELNRYLIIESASLIEIYTIENAPPEKPHPWNSLHKRNETTEKVKEYILTNSDSTIKVKGKDLIHLVNSANKKITYQNGKYYFRYDFIHLLQGTILVDTEGHCSGKVKIDDQFMSKHQADSIGSLVVSNYLGDFISTTFKSFEVGLIPYWMYGTDSEYFYKIYCDGTVVIMKKNETIYIENAWGKDEIPKNLLNLYVDYQFKKLINIEKNRGGTESTYGNDICITKKYTFSNVPEDAELKKYLIKVSKEGHVKLYKGRTVIGKMNISVDKLSLKESILKIEEYLTELTSSKYKFEKSIESSNGKVKSIKLTYQDYYNASYLVQVCQSGETVIIENDKLIHESNFFR